MKYPTKKRPVKAYSCWPRDESFHMIVFTTNAPRARLLGSQADSAIAPSKRHSAGWNDQPGVVNYVTARLPEADGVCKRKCVWLDPKDAPETLREFAATLWSELDDASCEAND